MGAPEKFLPEDSQCSVVFLRGILPQKIQYLQTFRLAKTTIVYFYKIVNIEEPQEAATGHADRCDAFLPLLAFTPIFVSSNPAGGWPIIPLPPSATIPFFPDHQQLAFQCTTPRSGARSWLPPLAHPLSRARCECRLRPSSPFLLSPSQAA